MMHGQKNIKLFKNLYIQPTEGIYVLWFSEQPSIIPIQHLLLFITKTECVNCVVQLNIWMSFNLLLVLRRLNTLVSFIFPGNVVYFSANDLSLYDKHVARMVSWTLLVCFHAICYLMQVPAIQGEHKNTPWFQVVIKSKLTGIFL